MRRPSVGLAIGTEAPRFEGKGHTFESCRAGSGYHAGLRYGKMQLGFKFNYSEGRVLFKIVQRLSLNDRIEVIQWRENREISSREVGATEGRSSCRGHPPTRSKVSRIVSSS